MFGLFVGVLSVVSIALSVIDIGMRVCQSLGIVKKETTPEELGDRALQAQEKGIKIEDYEGRYDEYMDAIDSVELDPDKSEHYKPEEKQKAAATVLGIGLAEHYGRESGVDKFLSTEMVEDNREFYQPDRVVAYLDTFKKNGENMDNIGKYFDSKLDSMQEIRQVDANLVEAEKKLGASEVEAKDHLDLEKTRRSSSS